MHQLHVCRVDEVGMLHHLGDFRSGWIRFRQPALLHVPQGERSGLVHAGHGKRVERSTRIVDDDVLAGFEAADQVGGRTPRFHVHNRRPHVRHWGTDRRLRRS